MITDAYSSILPDISMRSMLKQEAVSERERELNIYRSGSAPPTVEGSLSSIGGLFDAKKSDNGGFFTDEEIRSDPAYINYYYANSKLNPRLPPPLLSKEDWRSSHRVHGVVGVNSGGGVGGGVDNEENGSLFSVQPAFGGGNEENGNENGGVEWGGDGLIGLPGLGLGSRQKSIAEIIQDEMGQPNPIARHPSRPVSRNAFGDDVDFPEDRLTLLQSDLASLGALRSSANKHGASASQTYAAALSASLSRSNTPDPQLVARAPSPRVPPIGEGRTSSMDKRDSNSLNSFNNVEHVELAAALSGLHISPNGMANEENHSRIHVQQKINDQNRIKQQPYLNKSVSSNYRSSPFTNYGLSAYASTPSSQPILGSQLRNSPLSFENVAAQSVMAGGTSLLPNLIDAATELQSLGRIGNHGPLMDPLYGQYLGSNPYMAAQLASPNNPMMEREYLGNSYVDLLQKACLGSLLSPKSPFGVPYLGKSGHNYYANPAFGLGMSYPGSPILPNSPIGPGSPMRHVDWNMRLSPEEMFASSLLAEFKSNKTRSFELSEIAGHVVEFSADQYGSRFIQQKLETTTTEEKDMVFNEIMPQALTLMTDVFGNYVVQKFLEHGSPPQIRELANQLSGNVLTLSLQMYGCRVIQKAIEVVEVDQKISMVKELDGNIMRCVRDQNGNHVIQKCIECVPEDEIQFIVLTFYDQVFSLSTHPYGCRIIQRVLEHCHKPKTQQIMMDEILKSVCVLAKDQYGNYVVQHVLEHGKPHERTAIINKLTGQIVQMSQQKFASNVIEKCLTFGTAQERQNIVNEMLGTTDENEPLQVMMKDQFANYVVQKVLETCDDQQLELILNRIKVHLNALKKYTYGKHIVARIEKLVAAGERRISVLILQSPTPSA